MIIQSQEKQKRKTNRKRLPEAARPLLEAQRNYDRRQAAFAVGCAVITLIRAYDAGHLSAYRVGRRVVHSGRHLLDWLESGGKTA